MTFRAVTWLAICLQGKYGDVSEQLVKKMDATLAPVRESNPQRHTGCAEDLIATAE